MHSMLTNVSSASQLWYTWQKSFFEIMEICIPKNNFLHETGSVQQGTETHFSRVSSTLAFITTAIHYAKRAFFKPTSSR